MIPLIKGVRVAREEGYKFVAINRDMGMFAYTQIPRVSSGQWASNGGDIFLGMYNMHCDWKDTLIDLTKLKVE